MDLSAIAVGTNPPHDVNVIIEVPIGGEPIKYELHKPSGILFVDRFLYTSMRYPGNYGFIPHTLSDDGDPFGALEVEPDRAARAGERIAGQLPAAIALDPDHLGAMIGQHHPAEGRRAQPLHFEDADAGERARHQRASMIVTLATPPPSHIVCRP